MTPQFRIKLMLAMSGLVALVGAISERWVLAIFGLMLFTLTGYVMHQANRVAKASGK